MALEGIYFSSPRLQKQYQAATAKHPRGIMNTAYDNSERPHTPSYIGNYESFPENGPGASYVYREEPPVKKAPLPSSSSTVGFLPPEKKAQHGRDRRGKDFIVVALLIFFMAVAIVMVALYFSRDSQDEKVTENGEQTGNTPTPPPLCRTLPKPVAFNTLPQRIQDELSSMESLFEEQIKLGGPSAVTANIVYMDRVIWRGEYGVLNNSQIPKRKPTDETIFPIASVSKVLTALMLYKLYDDGFVNSLDDSVTDYQTNFLVKNPYGSAPITLRELASHRSGLPREAPCYPDTKTNFCPYTNDQMIQRMRNVTLLHEPGKEPYYSNLGFALLGQVLGQRFGNGYEGWMRNNILSRFDMSNTFFNLDDSIRQRIPENEFSDPTEWGWLNPTGGCFSTVADFAKVATKLRAVTQIPY